MTVWLCIAIWYWLRVYVPLHFDIMTSQSITITWCFAIHYGDVIMGAIASQITSLTIVYSTVYSDADLSNYQSPASLAFVRGIHRGPVNSPQKWPVTRKIWWRHHDLSRSSLLMKSWHRWVMWSKYSKQVRFFLVPLITYTDRFFQLTLLDHFLHTGADNAFKSHLHGIGQMILQYQFTHEGRVTHLGVTNICHH